MRSAAPASSAMYSGFSYRMSITPVPISIRLVLAPTAASSGNGEAELAGEVVHPEVGAVGAQLLRRDGQLDRLGQHVGGGPGLGTGDRRPMPERQEADLLHPDVNPVPSRIHSAA